VALVGAALVLAMASLLPWDDFGGIALIRVSGMEMGGIVTLPMAGLAVVGPVLAFVLRRPVLTATAAAPGLVAASVVLRDLRWLRTQPHMIDYSHYPLAGIYLAGLAAAGLVVGGLVALGVVIMKPGPVHR
jgi:hypothetical protein